MLVQELMQQTMMESSAEREGRGQEGWGHEGTQWQWLWSDQGDAGYGGTERFGCARLNHQGRGRTREEGPEGTGSEMGVEGQGGAWPRRGCGCGWGRGWGAEGVATGGVAWRAWPWGSPVDVVVERVVAPESYQGSQAQSVGEEDLGGCIQPHLQAE